MNNSIKYVCIIAIVISIIAIVLYFSVFHNGLSNDSASWSNFGDYVNGILTPILTLVNIFVFVKLTTTISAIESKRAEDLLSQEKQHSENELKQAKIQFEKQLEQAKNQFEKQLEHEKSLMYFQQRKQELNTFCQSVNESLSLYPKEEIIGKLERTSSYLDTFISSGFKLFMIDDKGITERKIQRLKIDINTMSVNFMDNKPLDYDLFNRIMDERDSIVKTLQNNTFCYF